MRQTSPNPPVTARDGRAGRALNSKKTHNLRVFFKSGNRLWTATARKASYNIIQEIGIANTALTTGRTAQPTFLTSLS
jgi:hypothetical protein